jgi:hypothetical protein
MRCTALARVSGAALLLALLSGCGGDSTGTIAQPTANDLVPTATATATSTPPTGRSCPPGSQNLANIRDGGEGATFDTFSARWGQQAGVAAGTVAFGRYADTGRQVVSAPDHLPPSNRVWTVEYFVDTTVQVSLNQAATIAVSILPKDATPLVAPQRNGDGVTAFYCSASMLAAFPPGTSIDGQPMSDIGLLTVVYILRADDSVDSVGVGSGCRSSPSCPRA